MTDRSNSLVACACVAVGALILLLPALIAGRPFIFWDTPAYYGWGHDILAAVRQPWPPLADFPTHRGLWAAFDIPGGWERITPQQFQLVLSYIGSRSKFYAVPLYALGSTLGLWAPAIIQSLLVSGILWITARAVLARSAPRATVAPAHLAVVALLTIATTAPFYAAFLMPDVFAPVGVLAVALLLYFPDRLTRAERVQCAVIVVAAALVHMSNFAVLIALLAITAAISRLLPPPVSARRGARIVVATLLVAAAVGAASDAGVRSLFGQPVRTAPFLEGRVIADGPGHQFLRETCATQHWAACRYKDLRVMYSDDIIWPNQSWHNLPLIADPAERNRFLDEQIPIVLGTLLHHPLAQLRHSLANAVHMFLDFRISESIGGSLSGMLTANPGLAKWVRQTVPNLGPCLASSKACDYQPLMQSLEKLQFVVVVVAFAALALRLWWWYANLRIGQLDKERQRLAVFVLSVVGAVIANAAICGATAGVYERYQARIVWLVPMLAAMIEMREAAVRTRVVSVQDAIPRDVDQPLLGREEHSGEAMRRPLS